ncbi:MAG: RHS repeat-associated core domain-containing protein, partial [Candidatus Binataceae bacterium]
LTTDPVSGNSYSWNAKDELLTAGTDSYTYDAGGRREIVNSSNTTISYLYDGSTPVQITTTPSGSVTSIMAMPDSNEILSIGGSVLLHDGLGSTVGGVGSNGSLVFQYSYDPYGNFSATGTPPSGYGNVCAMAGIENDPSGLYHANARYYSPALTRFLSEDPERGKTNMFTYAGENAISGSDTSGMDDCGDDCDEDGGGGGAGVGNPAAGFIQDIVSILNWIFNSNQPSSSAIATTAYSTNVQLTAQDGTSFKAAGLDRHFNTFNQGKIVLVQEEEDEPERELEQAYELNRILEGKLPVIPSEGLLIRTENGDYIVYQWQYERPADNGEGSIFRNGPNTTMRVMGPVTEGEYQYPNGYVAFQNETGQKIDPNTRRTIPEDDLLAHIPLLR